MHRWIYILLMLCFAAGGCAGRKTSAPTMQPPELQISLKAFSGTALGGPVAALSTTQPATQPANDALAVRMAWVARASDVPALGETLGQRARLVVSLRDGTPVLPSNRITMGSRLIVGASARAVADSIRQEIPVKAVSITEPALALRRGTTITSTVRSPTGENLPAVSVAVSRGAGNDPSLELAVTLIDRVIIPDESADDPADTRSDLPPAPPRTALQTETVVLPANSDDAPWVLLLPAALGPESSGSLAVLIQAAPGSDDTEHAALDELTAQLIATTAADAAKPSIDPAALAARSSVESALAIARDPRRLRAAVVVLTTATPAPFAADLAVSADDELLTQLAARLSEQLPNAPPDLSPEQWGLAIDLVALRLAGELHSNNKAPAEVEAVLAIHTGEAGRSAGTIEEMIKGVSRRADLDTRLIAENFIYLEDNSPAARTRAYDWLAARGQAPAGFDPLADPRARRAALDAALAASTQPAQP